MPDQGELYDSLQTSFIIVNSVWWSLFLFLVLWFAVVSYRRVSESLRPATPFFSSPVPGYSVSHWNPH